MRWDHLINLRALIVVRCVWYHMTLTSPPRECSKILRPELFLISILFSCIERYFVLFSYLCETTTWSYSQIVGGMWERVLKILEDTWRLLMWGSLLWPRQPYYRPEQVSIILIAVSLWIEKYLSRVKLSRRTESVNPMFPRTASVHDKGKHNLMATLSVWSTVQKRIMFNVWCTCKSIVWIQKRWTNRERRRICWINLSCKPISSFHFCGK